MKNVTCFLILSFVPLISGRLVNEKIKTYGKNRNTDLHLACNLIETDAENGLRYFNLAIKKFKEYINVKNAQGLTPMHLLLSKFNNDQTDIFMKIAQKLIDCGADLLVKNTKKEIPYDYLHYVSGGITDDSGLLYELIWNETEKQNLTRNVIDLSNYSNDNYNYTMPYENEEYNSNHDARTNVFLPIQHDNLEDEYQESAWYEEDYDGDTDTENSYNITTQEMDNIIHELDNAVVVTANQEESDDSLESTTYSSDESE